jgi:hypothetical protein
MGRTSNEFFFRYFDLSISGEREEEERGRKREWKKLPLARWLFLLLFSIFLWGGHGTEVEGGDD